MTTVSTDCLWPHLLRLHVNVARDEELRTKDNLHPGFLNMNMTMGILMVRRKWPLRMVMKDDGNLRIGDEDNARARVKTWEEKGFDGFR